MNYFRSLRVARQRLVAKYSKSSDTRQKIVILGTGWGSYSVLKTINRQLYDVKVVAPRNHFLFTPMLCSTAVGTLEFRSIIESVRNLGFEDPRDFLLGNAEELDVANQRITCRGLFTNETFTIPFDKLVIGVGCLPNTFGVPGVEEHGLFLKEILDAQKIRKKILSNCEKALSPNITTAEMKQLLHTVIVGGGPTGVEFGAELYDFKVKDVHRLYQSSEDNFKVTLVEAAVILGSFDATLRSYAEKKLSERPNFTLLKTSVVEVTKDTVVLKDGTILPCGLVVWSTGLSPRPFTQNLNIKKNEKGQILTDNYLRILGSPQGNIYAIGDCADIEGLALPCTAQVAERQGRYVAKFLNDIAKGREGQPFQYKSHGMLAYIGDYKALTDLPEFRLQGFASWLLWRSAYLTRLGSWRLRMQVPMDWLKTLIFGRDTSNFY